MIVPWHDERTRTGAFQLTNSCLLTLTGTGKKRRPCELPMTTNFDAPLRTQTIITDKVYSGGRTDFFFIFYTVYVGCVSNPAARCVRNALRQDPPS